MSPNIFVFVFVNLLRIYEINPKVGLRAFQSMGTSVDVDRMITECWPFSFPNWIAPFRSFSGNSFVLSKS